MSINGVVQSEFAYNALGQQVIRRLTVGGQTIHSVHDADGNRVAEYDYDPGTQISTLLREYVWMNGENVAVVEGGVVYYVRTDHIGRPVFATDDSGTKVWEASYLPFGGVHTSTGANSTLRFPGQWFQSEAGLHQNWMRDYDPTTGRYIQADPLGLVDGASVYNYVSLNPHSYIDPRGERGRPFNQSPAARLNEALGQHQRRNNQVTPVPNDMSTWPQFTPDSIPDPANINEGQNCTINSCFLRTEVQPEQLEEAGFDYGPRVKACLYRCPSGKVKMRPTSTNFACPLTLPDFPGETFNDASSADLFKLRIAGVRY